MTTSTASRTSPIVSSFNSSDISVSVRWNTSGPGHANLTADVSVAEGVEREELSEEKTKFVLHAASNKAKRHGGEDREYYAEVIADLMK